MDSLAEGYVIVDTTSNTQFVRIAKVALVTIG